MGWAAAGLCGMLFLALCYAPLVAAFSAFAGGGEAGAADWARRLGLLWSSLRLAGVAALGATLLGAPAGLLLARVRLPLRPLLLSLCAAFLVVPPYVFAIAWLGAFGAAGRWLAPLRDASAPAWDPYHWWVGALVLAWAFFPIVLLSTWAGLWAQPRAREEWARLCTGPLSALLRATLPGARDAILLGAGLVFLLAWSDFSVPDLFRARVYAAEVFSEWSAFHRLGPTLSGVAPLTLGGLAILAGLLLYRSEAAFRAGSRGAGPNPPLRLSGPARLLAWSAWGLVLALLALPLAVLADGARPWADFVLAWRSAGPELLLTLRVALLAALLSGLVGWGCARLIVPRPDRQRQALLALALLPLFVPAPLLGIGLIRLWNRAGAMGWVYQHESILVLAAAAKFLPLAILAWCAGLRRIPRGLHEAARLEGLSPLAWQARVVLPLTWRFALLGMALVFAFSVGELGASLLVVPPGVTTLSVRIFTLLHYGADRMVAALCLLVVLCIAIPMGVALAALERRPSWGR